MTGVDDPRTAELSQHLATVHERLAAAVAAAGRRPDDVELLVVTKFFPADDVARLISLGERAFGESREPEASRKIAALRAGDASGPIAAGDVSFDMIGSVQTKKARSVARWARSVHSVDREKLVEHLARAADAARAEGARTEPLGVNLQVSLDGDPTRGGALESELPALADRVMASDSLRLSGLMVIAPVDGSADRWMARAQLVHQAFVAHYPQATTLSAGMSGDLEAAVAHGSTCVRVGTAILGQRPLVSQ
ncbi:YggS family pyridoxal phosphate-dependent enzyme [Gordonia sp. NPDC003429]